MGWFETLLTYRQISAINSAYSKEYRKPAPFRSSERPATSAPAPWLLQIRDGTPLRRQDRGNDPSTPVNPAMGNATKKPRSHSTPVTICSGVARTTASVVRVPKAQEVVGNLGRFGNQSGRPRPLVAARHGQLWASCPCHPFARSRTVTGVRSQCSCACVRRASCPSRSKFADVDRSRFPRRPNRNFRARFRSRRRPVVAMALLVGNADDRWSSTGSLAEGWGADALARRRANRRKTHKASQTGGRSHGPQVRHAFRRRLRDRFRCGILLLRLPRWEGHHPSLERRRLADAVTVEVGRGRARQSQAPRTPWAFDRKVAPSR